ncbi:MAG TPA: S41 family peptidase [Gemmatimonadaceae bacterium]|nr:S41 family peptidase [Gemmatimonadaceae bacterium]
MRFAPLLALACASLSFVSPALRAQQPTSVQAPTPGAAAQAAGLGYYRFPSISGETIVFTAEGDLWRVGIGGGVAQRLTTHPAEETRGVVSPDGRTLAFSASYEGPTEVYTMPLEGGIPVRRTYDGATALVVGWTPKGEVLYGTRRYSGLPNTQLATVDPATGARAMVPLAQASDGAYDGAGGSTFYFTRFPFQGSYTKRYRGGTAQNLWKFTGAGKEAVPLTADYAGTSKTPMVWGGRIYFASDRDGTMNLWSMDAAGGGDVRQHTKHVGFDVTAPSLGGGRIVYQLGGDVRVYDIARGSDQPVPIRLVSDFDQTRERWVRSPMEWVTAAHLSPTGDRVVLTARGQLFVAPTGQTGGRVVEATRNKRVRYREGRFFPDGKGLLALSDESGEVEFWRVPANGIGAGERLTTDARVLRWDGVPSPDGRYVAHIDKDLQLWLYDTQKRTQTRLAVEKEGDFRDVEWSPDSKWLAYVAPEPNQMSRLWVYGVEAAKSTPITTDRYDSYSPAWSPDGKWLYFLSDRHFQSVVPGPWGSRQPEPFFDKQTKLYHVSMRPGERSPFQPDDELFVSTPQPSRGADSLRAMVDSSRTAAARRGGPPKQGVAPAAPAPVDLTGVEARLIEVPLAPGNYGGLGTDGKRLYFISADATPGQPRGTLRTLEISNKRAQPETFMDDIRSYELSLDHKKVMVRRANDLYVMDAGAKAPEGAALAKVQVPLRDWAFRLDPRDEWRQMFVEAWRLERDYFYDRNMHGVDWNAIRGRYLPLVVRVTDRAELSDVLAQMVGELSALHIFVRGGDLRAGRDTVQPASLGATFARDERAGGYRVEHVYATDPDIPEELAPLARPESRVAEGEVIESVNGVPTLSVPDIGHLLRDQAGKQVLLRVRPKGGGAAAREVVAVPVSLTRDNDLRYDEWEYTRRLAVEKASNGKMGYVHLRAMGSANIAEWQREFYPVFNREGLIVDVRHNQGGNIDSWILEKLMRKAFIYWQPRVGEPYWNMQYAFRGHVVVLTDEFTASDGELFAEGFRRLGLGKVIGSRTWGGEIWLSSSNFLVDRGIATAAEFGVYGPEGEWLIEGHGVDPDIAVDNLPHATFTGGDAQLDAAVKFLAEEIRTKPVPVPPAPKYPDKSLKVLGADGGAGAGGVPKREQ